MSREIDHAAESSRSETPPIPPELARYARQIRFAPLGVEGQERLGTARVLLCGCGALGSVLANSLARAGVGHLRIVDRDFVELNNLQRQVLYTEADVKDGLPKAIAAARRLQAVNSQIEIEPIVVDVDHTNIGRLAGDVDLILDGTDNFEIRYLLNDAAIEFQKPWVYGGCLGAIGQTMTILPGEPPCFRCLHPEAPPPGTADTCDSAGILGPIVNIVASLQSAEAVKILSGHREAVNRDLLVWELWENRVRQIRLDALRDAGPCPACGGHDLPWLAGERGSHTAVLCGRNAVQLSFPERSTLSLAALETRLRGVGAVVRNDYLLRLDVDRFSLTVFPDGRAIIKGTEQVAEARTLYARYVGS